MKILFISDVYFPRVNGVSTSIETFRRELRALGHTVHLIAPDYGTPSTDESDITRIAARQIPMDPEDRLMRYSLVIAQLERLRGEGYDLIHIQTPFVAHYLGTRLSRELSIPCVETYHTFFEEYFHHYVPFLPKMVTSALARRFSRSQGNSLDGMVIPSSQMLAVLRAYGVQAHAEVIPTGLEPASFVRGDRDDFRSRYDIPSKRPLMLFLGRVAHEKNIGFLLGVAERVRKDIPDVLLMIAGEGPALEGLKHRVDKMGMQNNVRFMGYLNRDTELNDCYRAADVFVFSSRTETQGLVLLEAMAQAVPVVSIAEMGTRDVLKEGAGVWIAQEEHEAFAGKVVALLKDEDTRIRLGEAGREYALGWSASTQAHRVMDFYRSVKIKQSETKEVALIPAASAE